MYRIRSKSSGSYQGSYPTWKDALLSAQVANQEERYGMKDWVPSKKSVRTKSPTDKSYQAIGAALGAVTEAAETCRTEEAMAAAAILVKAAVLIRQAQQSLSSRRSPKLAR